MKKLTPFAVLLLVVIVSCKKTQVKPSSPGFTGRWSLVKDSSIFEPSGSQPENSIYAGNPADYFDFRANGMMQWSEKAMGSDSGSYAMHAGNIVSLSYFPKSSPYYSDDTTVPFTITSLTAHEMILTDSPTPSSGGIIIGEIITLSR